MIKYIFLLTILNFLIGTIKAQERAVLYIPTRQDTLNGSITSERIWWDIQHYDLTIGHALIVDIQLEKQMVN